jgi:hypothetical protein
MVLYTAELLNQHVGLDSISGRLLSVFVAVDAPHIMAPMLFVEASTIFLTVVRADIFPDTVSMLNQALFVLTFILCRIVVVPLVWVKLMLTMRQNWSETVFQECYPPYFMPVCFFFGVRSTIA